MLEEKRAGVHVGIDTCRRAAPVGQMRGRAGDIAEARGAEIAGDGGGVGGRGPDGAGRAAVYGVLAHRRFAEFVGEKTVHDLGAEDEPPFGLPAAGHDRIVVISRRQRRIALIVQHFADHGGEMGVVLGGHTRHDDVRQIVAGHVGVQVVGDAVRIPGGTEDAAAAAAVVAQHENGHRRHGPVIVRIGDVRLDVGGAVAAQCGGGHHAGPDALFVTPVSERIGPGHERGLIGTDDDVLEISAFRIRLGRRGDPGQGTVIEEAVLEDRLEPAVPQPTIAELSIPPTESDLDPQVTVDHQLLGDRVILERGDAEHGGVHAADAGNGG